MCGEGSDRHMLARAKKKKRWLCCWPELRFCPGSLSFCGRGLETPFMFTAVTASLTKPNEHYWEQFAADTADCGTALLSRLCHRQGPMCTSRMCTYFLFFRGRAEGTLK